MLRKIYDLFNATWHKNIFIHIHNLSFILLFIAFTGIVSISPLYLNIIEKFIQYYVCFILLVKFNPFKFKSNIIDVYDRKIAFTAGLLLFYTTSVSHIMKTFFIKELNNLHRI
jgi:hypothetical protein